MCIQVIKNPKTVVVKNGRLKLWKVVRKDNVIGIWNETQWQNSSNKKFRIGKNVAVPYYDFNFKHNEPAFHCFFTRRDARQYMNFRLSRWNQSRHNRRTVIKIIRVYVDFKDVVKVGVDRLTNIPAISVSKMTIKSLKHQR